MAVAEQSSDIGTPHPSIGWVSWWLTLLPPLYILAPLGVIGLPGLRLFSKPVLTILTIYAVSQQIPALFSPEPLIASILALLRTFLLFGLLGLGALMGSKHQVRFLIPGLVIVYMTAAGSALLSHTDLSVVRLNHPYLTSTALGLSGAFGVWLALFMQGHLIWRAPLGMFALGIIMLSGSRGPLLAAIIGALIGLFMQIGRRTILISLVGISVIISGFMIGARFDLPSITRLDTSDTTGRDIVWSNTVSVIMAYPITGVGSYLLGSHLTPPNQKCEFFTDSKGMPQSCPGFLSKIGNPWIIAHNIILQQLAETGPLGLMGLLCLLGLSLYAVLKEGEPLFTAIFIGMLLTNIIDNTIIVPNPFFAEVFWLIAGIHLRKIDSIHLSILAIIPAISIFLHIPVILSFNDKTSHKIYSINFLLKQKSIKNDAVYTLYAQITAPAGEYRLDLQSCSKSCVTLLTKQISISNEFSPLVNMSAHINSEPNQEINLRLFNGKSKFSILPLAEYKWMVEEKND